VFQGKNLSGRHIPQIAFCQEKNRLLNDLLHTIHELNAIQSEQARAVIEGADFCRFDVLIHMAQEKKDLAKYAWIAHVEAHHCHEGEYADDTDTT